MKLRIGVIGSGFGLYGLLPAFLSTKDCEVIALCGKQSERLTTYASNIGLTHLYTSWEEMLDKENLDAIAIAVIPSVQYYIAKKAIEKGLHVFAEKPLTANLSDARELQKLAEEKGVTTMVDFIFPEIDEWQKAKELIKDKKYGELKEIHVAWDFLSYDIKNGIIGWKTDIKQGGGALSFFGSHALYYVSFFAGEILKIKGVLGYFPGSKNGADTEADLDVLFQNGVAGKIHVSCNNRYLTKHDVTLICERGTLLLESTTGVTEHFSLSVTTDTSKNIIPVQKNTASLSGEDERVRVVKKLTTRFVEGAIRKTKVTPAFKDGLAVQELIEKVRN